MKQVNLQSLLSIQKALHTHDILGVHQNETKYVFLSPRLLWKSASGVEQTVNMKQVNLQSLLSIPQALHTHDVLGVHT
jgi:hypothetical protein